MSGAPTPEVQRPSQTKIVATIGPASDGEEQLAELIRAGVDVFRINAAHGNRPEHERRLAACRAASESVGWPVAVLVDLAGPKMRLGELAGGQLDLAAGDRLRFVRGDQPGRPGELTSTYELLIDELAAGDRIMLADGTVSLVVEQVGADEAVCRVVQPGTVRSRQGVNLPGVKLSAPALGEADRDNARWAARGGVDFLGLSFVRGPDEVHQLKALIEAEGAQAQVIAKIEKPEALDRLEEIVEAADAIMVARGDLGVEIDIAQMAVAQKRIVALCNQRRKPVIIATQMLDSMQHSRIPTRAEVADTSNAVLDGADACMLSGETAAGEYPRESVEMMHRIALATERLFKQRSRNHVAVEAAGVSSGDFEEITEVTAKSAAARSTAPTPPRTPRPRRAPVALGVGRDWQVGGVCYGWASDAVAAPAGYRASPVGDRYAHRGGAGRVQRRAVPDGGGAGHEEGEPPHPVHAGEKLSRPGRARGVGVGDGNEDDKER